MWSLIFTDFNHKSILSKCQGIKKSVNVLTIKDNICCDSSFRTDCLCSPDIDVMNIISQIIVSKNLLWFQLYFQQPFEWYFHWFVNLIIKIFHNLKSIKKFPAIINGSCDPSLPENNNNQSETEFIKMIKEVYFIMITFLHLPSHAFILECNRHYDKKLKI